MICKNIALDPEKLAVFLTTYLLEDSPEFDTGKCRPAILILSGGGYFLTSDREAEFVALSFAAKGYHAFVLRYSVGKNAAMPRPVLEGFTALALIRQHADEWHIEPGQIFVCGFSAGGHVASCMLTMWHRPEPARELKLPNEVFRPDAGILCYPCIVFPCPPLLMNTMVPVEHRNLLLQKISGLALPDFCADAFFERDGMIWVDGSQLMQSLMMGKSDFTPEEIRSYSTNLLVDEQTPPAFVWTTRTDKTVPPSDSMAFTQAMMAAEWPVEMHLFGTGEHGLSLAEETTAGKPEMVSKTVAQWFPIALAWLERVREGRL